MNKSTKIWYGVGACVTLAAATTIATRDESGTMDLALLPKAHAADAKPAGRFPGNLTLALDNIFAGEGGEGGEGLTAMWPTVSAPALTGPEIVQVVSGNTLQLPGHASYYFAPGNTVEGLYIDWHQRPKSECPAKNVEGGEYYLNPKDGICWKESLLPASGRWSVRNHQLCLEVSWSGGGKQGCRYLTILLDDVALFDASGQIDGKGHSLLEGKQLEQD